MSKKTFYLIHSCLSFSKEEKLDFFHVRSKLLFQFSLSFQLIHVFYVALSLCDLHLMQSLGGYHNQKMGHFPKVHGLNAFTWISAKIRIKGLESGNARRWKFETLIPRRIWFHRNSIPLDGIRGKSYYNLGDFFDFVTECPNIFFGVA